MSGPFFDGPRVRCTVAMHFGPDGGPEAFLGGTRSEVRKDQQSRDIRVKSNTRHKVTSYHLRTAGVGRTRIWVKKEKRELVKGGMSGRAREKIGEVVGDEKRSAVVNVGGEKKKFRDLGKARDGGNGGSTTRASYEMKWGEEKTLSFTVRVSGQGRWRPGGDNKKKKRAIGVRGTQRVSPNSVRETIVQHGSGGGGGDCDRVPRPAPRVKYCERRCSLRGGTAHHKKRRTGARLFGPQMVNGVERGRP